MTDQEDYDAARAEAASTFDLQAKYQKIGMREGQITLYVDEKTGDALGSAHDEKNQFGIVIKRVQEGVLGEIDRLALEIAALGDDEEAIASKRALLENAIARRDELIAKLESTALVFKLRAVPPVVAKSAKRRARESLKIKGKVTEDQMEQFNDSYVAHLLSDTIVSITDNESGGVLGKQTYEQCLLHKQHLPEDQFARLDKKLAEIQFKELVDESIASDSDF